LPRDLHQLAAIADDASQLEIVLEQAAQTLRDYRVVVSDKDFGA
jgi:hypothetical protein